MYPALSSQTETLRSGPGRFLIFRRDTDKSFEVGQEDFYLLKLIDGKHSLDQIRDEFQQRFKQSLSPRYLLEFLNQLRLEGLLKKFDDEEDSQPQAIETSLPPAPLSTCDPGAALNHRFNILTMLLGWLISPLGAGLTILVALVAITGVVRDFNGGVSELFRLQWQTPVPLIFLALLAKLFLFDLWKSLMVGVACRKLGGRVSRFGMILFRGVFPAIVCDIGASAGSLSSRGGRILSGIRVWTVLAITALAAVAWLMAEPLSKFREVTLLITFIGTINLFISLNFFLPLDGHTILVQALRVPRLYWRARAETSAWLTLQISAEPLTDRLRFWFRVYGSISILLTFVLQAVIIFGGFWWISQRYQGIGALVVILLSVVWYWQSIKEKFVEKNSIKWLVRGGGKPVIRWSIRSIVVLGIFALGFIPYNHEVGGQCRLLPYTQSGVRAQLEDEIVAVYFKEGDWVEAGQTIAKLSGRQIIAKVKATEAERAQAIAELNVMLGGTRDEELEIGRRKVKRARVELEFQHSEYIRASELGKQYLISDETLESSRKLRDVARENLLVERSELILLENGVREQVIQAERERIKEIEARLELYKKNQELLEIRSPISGKIVTPYLSERLGQVAESGDLIAVIQDTSRLVVEIASDEQTATHVRKGMEAKVRLTALDGELLLGYVTKLASTTEKEKLFGIDPFRSDRELYIEQSLGFSEDEHMFRLYAELDDHAATLIPGMTGYARVVIDEGILWDAIFRPITRFFRTDVWSWLP
jgi:multidrug efflux pump subunit AcrA (membrane-fusion protein)